MRHVVLYRLTDVSEELSASDVKTMVISREMSIVVFDVCDGIHAVRGSDVTGHMFRKTWPRTKIQRMFCSHLRDSTGRHVNLVLGSMQTGLPTAEWHFYEVT